MGTSDKINSFPYSSLGMDISVVIPTYNRYDFLKRALASVYAQTYLPKEVIVIDDGSTDNTANIQKDFPTIKYIYQENAGVSSARNTGIKSGTYEWIAFLDSDDTWHKDKLSEQVLFHQKNPNIFISYTDEKWIRDSKEVKVPKKFRKFGGDIFNECLSHCIIAPSASLLHRSLFEKVAYFDESLEVCEDYDLWLQIAVKYEIGLVDKKLITKYAGHVDQLSFKHWGMDRFRVIALEKLMESSKKETVQDILVQKYRLLLKGAIKYDKMSNIKEYEGKIKLYE